MSWVYSMDKNPECWIAKEVMDLSLSSCISADLHPLVIKSGNETSSFQTDDQIDPRVAGRVSSSSGSGFKDPNVGDRTTTLRISLNHDNFPLSR